MGPGSGLGHGGAGNVSVFVRSKDNKLWVRTHTGGGTSTAGGKNDAISTSSSNTTAPKMSAAWKASMYIWAEIPEFYRGLGSLEFSKKLLDDAKIAVSPGVGFGDYGDDYVRIALIENEHRLRQAVRGIRDMFRKDSRA